MYYSQKNVDLGLTGLILSLFKFYLAVLAWDIIRSLYFHKTVITVAATKKAKQIKRPTKSIKKISYKYQ